MDNKREEEKKSQFKFKYTPPHFQQHVLKCLEREDTWITTVEGIDTKPRIMCDFHGMEDDNYGRDYLHLKCAGSYADIEMQELQLYSGLEITVDNEEIEVDAVIGRCPKEQKFIAVFDPDQIRNIEYTGLEYRGVRAKVRSVESDDEDYSEDCQYIWSAEDTHWIAGGHAKDVRSLRYDFKETVDFYFEVQIEIGEETPDERLQKEVDQLRESLGQEQEYASSLEDLLDEHNIDYSEVDDD